MNNNAKSTNLYSISIRRRFIKNFVEITLLSLTILILLPLVSIIFDIVSRGIPILIQEPITYFTERTKSPNDPVFGLNNALIGSVVIILAASFFAIPIGVLSGIYLAESDRIFSSISSPIILNRTKIILNLIVTILLLSILVVGFQSSDLLIMVIGTTLILFWIIPKHLYSPSVRLIADVLQSTPSIVAGLVLFTFWVIPKGTQGYGALPAGIALSFLMIPIVTRVTEEGIRTVPSSINEAAVSLGIPEWRIMLSIITRTASSVLLTGIMLAIARIAGETAPLIFTALETNFFWGWSTPTPTLTVKIFRYAISPYSDTWIRSAWSMATVLLSFIFLINILVRTNILKRVYENLLTRIFLVEFMIFGFFGVIELLFGNILQMILIGITVRALLLNYLAKKEILFKVIDNLGGKIIFLSFIGESILEIALFLINNYTNFVYIINFYFSLVVGIFFLSTFIYSIFSSKPTSQELIRSLLTITFGLVLAELATFQFYGINFFVGEIIYFVLLTGILIRLLLFDTIFSFEGKDFSQRLKNTIYGKIVIIFEILEVSVQIFFYSLLLFFKINILLNYVYVINYYVSIILIIVLIIFYTFKYLNDQGTNENRVKTLLIFLFALNIFNYLFPINGQLMTQILIGLFLKSLITFVLLRNKLFKENFIKIVSVLVLLETIIEFIVLGLNLTEFTNFIYNFNYLYVILLGLYFINLILLKYKIIPQRVSNYV